uniref:Uncharacterized protein n=1 Tax=Xiphophorus maculatus TaxID=8083 RepID=A0A3B5R9J3_XIPMA
ISMQAKQKSLLKRVDALDEEREELQRQLEEKEEQAELSQQQRLILNLQKEKQTLQTRVEELEKHVAELMEHVQALRERERLLVAFPELNNWAHIQPQSTGNLILDMEQQQQSNNIRIKILEQENFTLHKSLEKLRQRGMLNITKSVKSFPQTNSGVRGHTKAAGPKYTSLQQTDGACDINILAHLRGSLNAALDAVW